MDDALLDRRSQRTRAALHRAFVEILLEDGYEALKIGAVTARANVGRSTFYEHYRTKQDLLRASIVGPFSTLADQVLATAPQQHMLTILRHFRENQQVARVLLSYPTRPLLAQALAELVLQRLGQAEAAMAAVLARQIADAQLALVDSWVLGRPWLEPDAAQDLLRRTSRALAGLMPSSLATASPTPHD